MKPNTEVSVEAWQAALAAATKKGADDPGFTREEFGYKMGYHASYARAVLRRLFLAGKLVCGQKRIETMSGGHATVPCYRLKK